MSSGIICTPSMFPNGSQFFCWKTSLADLMPNKSHLKWYLPHGVLTVHSMDDGLSSFIYQYPLSKMVNMDFTDNLHRASGVGMEKCCFLIATLRSRGSKHTLRDPFFFSVTTRLLTHSFKCIPAQYWGGGVFCDKKLQI